MNHVNPNRTTDPETLVQCPYDNTHMVRVLIWPRHIIKCRKNHPTRDLRTCPFNARHEVPAPELMHHIAMCPDQVIIHQEVLQEKKRAGEMNGTYIKGNTDVPPYDHEWDRPMATEDWDAEYNRNPVRVEPGYGNVTMPTLDRASLTPAQRREHRKLLKQHAERVRNHEPTDDIDAAIKALRKPRSGDGGAGSSGEEAVPVEQPPRMPHGLPQAVTHSRMNGVQRPGNPAPDAPAQKSRLAANFNNDLSGLGRGHARVVQSGSAGSNQMEKYHEILAALAKGRGVARPNNSYN